MNLHNYPDNPDTWAHRYFMRITAESMGKVAHNRQEKDWPKERPPRNVQPTSLDAYHTTEELRLSAKELIWEHMMSQGGAWCIRSISRALGIERSIVSPRIGELRDSGWLREVEKREDDQGRMVRHYIAIIPMDTPGEEQECE